MKSMRNLFNLAARMAALGVVSASCVGVNTASGTIVVGSMKFADMAFADKVISHNVPPHREFPTGATLEQTMVGADFESHIDTPFGAFIELGFASGALANIPGPDLAIFEMFSDSDPFYVSLTVGGPAALVPASEWEVVSTNAYGWEVRVARFDLDRLGVPRGAEVHSIVLSTPNSSVEFTAAGSLLPEPASWNLAALALAGATALGARRRGRPDAAP